jgi:hypothetical protein
MENWNAMDDDFSYPDFYWCIIKLLDGDDGQEVLSKFN